MNLDGGRQRPPFFCCQQQTVDRGRNGFNHDTLYTPRLAKFLALITGARLAVIFGENHLVCTGGPGPPIVAV